MWFLKTIIAAADTIYVYSVEYCHFIVRIAGKHSIDLETSTDVAHASVLKALPETSITCSIAITREDSTGMLQKKLNSINTLYCYNNITKDNTMRKEMK